jgi:hypothetical protein
MTDRAYAFLGAYKAAIAIDTQPVNEEGVSRVTLALALCNHRDQFEKRTARSILDGRIDNRLSGSNTRLTFQADYKGVRSRKDVMYPALDAIRGNLSDPPSCSSGRISHPISERNHADVVRAVHAVAAALATSTDPAYPVSVS